jgi:hypothetical protein
MPVSKNTWNKGLNSDFSKLKSQQDSYLDAKNIRVMTDEGSSTFAIENIRGNQFSFNIPPVEATYQLDVSSIQSSSQDNLFISFTRNSTYMVIVILNFKDKSNEFITNEINTKIQNYQTTFAGKQYIKFYYNSKYIVAYDFLPRSLGLESLTIAAYLPEDPANYMVLRTNRIVNHTILGWGYYNDTLVLITCPVNSNDENPEDIEGFIWAAAYDNATNTIQVADIDDNFLNPDTTLKYAGKLNLSRQYAIYKHLKCRYENNNTARVVWTDGYNTLRTCNVLDPQIWATPPELFSYIPIHAPQKPVISIIAGGTLPTGKYQYFYQLSSSQGAISTFSPVSNLMFAYPGDSINYATPGNNPGVNSQKSMQVFIQNLDTNYDTIRTGYVVYQVADVPEAFFFDERPVPDDGQFTIVHNGNENDIPVDSVNITNLNRSPEVFKTIDVVRNRLFAANARTTEFDLTDEFDARAYRFDGSGIARLYNNDDDYSNPSLLLDISNNTMFIESPSAVPLDYKLIPDTFDCINPFNQENNAYNKYSNNDWYNISQYKYQNYPPTIIGGKGLNISYQFVTKEMTAKAAKFSTANTFINPQSNYAINYTFEFSDTYTYPGGRGLTMDCMKNPILETLFTGYSRGEVYRFGIVFYDVFGYPSYPLWIGDIKFPFAYEEDNVGDTFGLTSLAGFDTPPRFTILDGRNIPADILTVDLIPGVPDHTLIININFNPVYEWNPSATSTMADFCAAFNEGNTLGVTVIQPDPLDLNTIQFIAPSSSEEWLTYPFNITDIYIGSNSDIFNFLTIPNSYSLDGNPVVVKQLGITFSLDTSGEQFQNIKDKISGYSYVRLKRETSDSTRLGTGCIQPTVAGNNNDYLLTPYEWNPDSGGPKWGFDGDSPDGERVRLGLQTYYSPNFAGRSLLGFNNGDYFRFIGRTNDYGTDQVVRYAAEITTPTYGTNFGYFIASNDFIYKYDDDTVSKWMVSVPEALNTNSYLPPPTGSGSRNIFPIKARVSAPYSTTGNTVDVDGLTFINMANGNVTQAQARTFSEWGVECIAVKFDNTISNFPNTTAIFRPTNVKLPFYLVSYERYLIEQYRGWTRADRYNNEYILTNHFQPIEGASNLFSDVYGGDTYVNYFDWQKTNVNFTDSSGGSGWARGSNEPGRGVAIFFPAEATFNTDMNTSAQRAAVRQTNGSIFASNYQFNPAYAQQNTTNIFISKGYLQSNVIDEPHTIYPSEPKLDGEGADSWRTLLINNALAVNGNYGEINRIIQFKDKLFFYQNDGIGVAAVDERVLANEGDTTQTQLGTGAVLQRFDYISTETGCKHSFAVESTGSSIYHYDSFINKLFKYSVGKTKEEISGMNPLTDVKGLSGFFRTAFVGSNIKSIDKILRSGAGVGRVGIVSSFNSEYNTVYFTFFDQPNNINYTISYNELLDSFESFYDFYPSMYINMRKRFLSIAISDTSSVYTHNIGNRNFFYNTYFPSSVTFRVNENSDFVKTFDNFQVNSEVILDNLQIAKSISRMSITNDYQKVLETNVNFVQKIRSWRLAIPRDDTNPALTIKPRISDKYIDVKFVYDVRVGQREPIEYFNNTFRLHDVLTEYSMRSKIVPK